MQASIDKGKWLAGEKIPSIRTLSQTYDCSKNTVIRALQSLEASGAISAREKVGYFVNQTRITETITQPVNRPAISEPKEVTVPKLFMAIMNQGAAFDIYPSATSAPANNNLIELNRHISSAMRINANDNSSYYDSPLGHQPLRSELAKHYRQLDLSVTSESICITSGCQHSLFLALMATCEPGDIVAVESPAFYGALQLLEQLKLNIVEIPSDLKEGVSVEAVEEILERWTVKAILVTPAFATPTGACIPDRAKPKLIGLAEKYDITIIEDDIYGDLGFDNRPRPLKSFESTERVILCSSFAKSISRDLRVGWIITSKLIDKIISLKMISQLACNRSTQQGLTNFIAQGGYRRHLNQYRTRLRKQCAQLVEVLSSRWPAKVSFNIPNGGLALWVELPAQIDTRELYQAAQQHHILIMPGMLFSASNQFNHFLRLSFAHPIESQRLEAITKLPTLF